MKNEFVGKSFADLEMKNEEIT